MTGKPRYRVRTDGTMVGRVRPGATNLAGSSLMGGFEGSQRQRRLFGFRPSEASINSLLVTAGPTLRARARWLVRNNPYAKKARRMFVSNLVGTGITPTPLIESAPLKKAIADLWGDWVDEADADGLTDFYGLQALAAGAMFDAGEMFIRRRPRRARDGLAVPMQLQLLESEYCPYDMNMVADNGNLIRAGIEFDRIGRRVAYWFWKTHPGETALPTREIGYTRVPAEDVLHLFEPLRPGQVRGVSWLAAAITRAYLLDQYDDAELERKKVAALFAGFVTSPNAEPDGPLAGQDQPSAGVAPQGLNAPGETTLGLTPGVLQVLEPGEAITFSAPADVGGNYEAFQYRALLALCAAMDMPYAGTTGDYNKANYSSLRAGMLDLRRAIEQIQHTVLSFQLCRGVWKWFVADAVLAKALPLSLAAFNKAPRKYQRAKWVPPKWDWVDPLKDVQAERIAVRSGFKSRAEVVAGQGYDLAQVDAEIALGNASADSLGLVLDSDPRRTNERGSAPAPDTAAPPAPDATALGQAEDNEEEAA